jgi:hypothetical protein
MSYVDESQLYPVIVRWLQPILQSNFKKANVTVYDTHQYVLSKFLYDNDLHTKFPAYQTYEINVDVVGVIEKYRELVFVECKLNKIKLVDLSQLLGYSRVANPLSSILISPVGLSFPMHLLFNVYRRYDVLNYSEKRFIRIAQWLETREDIDISSLLPIGSTIV